MDASFAVHDDMKSRTKMFMSLGSGTIHGGSMNQKINTNNSTFSELVGVLGSLTKILRCRYFMEAQGYVVEYVYVYQDN